MSKPPTQSTNSRVFRFFESFVYGGRWLIAPMYVGMLVVLGVYTYSFIHQVYELLLHFTTLTEGALMLTVLGLVDIMMIGCLLIVIMVGGYHIFIRRFNILSDSEKPQWLEHISSGSLKTKIGMSLIGVSSIHLLKDFVEETVHWDMVGKHAGIHLIFVISTLALAWTDKIMSTTAHSHEDDHEDDPVES